MQELLNRARFKPARIIFPESQDKRIQAAVKEIKKLNIAEPILFANENVNSQLLDFTFINPQDKKVIDRFAKVYYELRRNKGLSLELAKKLLEENSVYTAALMVREGLADALIAGASHTTRDVAKAVIHCIGAKDRKSISSCLVIETKRKEFGFDGKFIFADCGIIITPSAEQLAQIAIEAGELFRKLFEREPYIAFLSYSTYGSAGGESVEKIRQALGIVRAKRPEMKIDGELQLDAAIVKDIADIKCPNSEVAGRANVLIFPDLNSGNICYKIVDRLLNALSLGPIFLGTAKPASDLSRGCEIEEVVLVSAIISIIAQ